MELIKPSFGLLFWMLIGFGILFFILAKFAWPFITKSIANRNMKIQNQLDEAAKVHDQLANMQVKQEEIIAQAKLERDAILSEAHKISANLYEEAKLKANAEAQAIVEDAKKSIHFEKMKAMTEVKNQIANLSIDIAEKVLREELSDKQKQEQLVENWVKDCKLN